MVDYRKPSLIEILADVRLRSPSSSDRDAFLAAARWEQEEPGADISLDSRFSQVPDNESSEVVEPQQWVRVTRSTASLKRIAQFSRRGYVANLAGEYPGFAQFMKHARSVQRAVEENYPSSSAASLKLQLIDRFVAPTQGFSLATFFTRENSWIPYNLMSVSQDCDATWGSGFLAKHGQNRSGRLRVRYDEDTLLVTVTLDMVFQTTLSSGQSFDVVVDDLHREAVDAFERTITDEYRLTVMGGIAR